MRVIDYEELLQHAHKEHVQVLEDYPFCSQDLKGLYYNKTIALNKSLRTTAEKACILAESWTSSYLLRKYPGSKGCRKPQAGI